MLHFTYLIWLAIFLVAPLGILWFFFHKDLSRYYHVFVINEALLMLGLVWDNWGVHQKIWIFPSGSNMGHYIGYLPLEEYLAFFLFTLFVTSLTIVAYDYSRVRK